MCFELTIGSCLGFKLPVAVFAHTPMVTYSKKSDMIKKYRGLEVEIVRYLAIAMNFKPQFYESPNSQVERWGRQLPNGTYTGLIGELVRKKICSDYLKRE